MVITDADEYKYLKYKSPAECLAAVQKYGYAIQFVAEQTPELCMAAVIQNGFTLYHVKEQTPAICIAAVRSHGCALQYVKEQNGPICKAAVDQDPYSLCYVKEQTFDICCLAINRLQDSPMEMQKILAYIREPALRLSMTEYVKKKMNIEPAETTPFTQAKEKIDEPLEEILDMVSFENPKAGDIYGFSYNTSSGKLNCIASLQTFQMFVENSYKDSTQHKVFSPLHNCLICVKEIVWVRF